MEWNIFSMKEERTMWGRKGIFYRGQGSSGEEEGLEKYNMCTTML